jgi:hypothetical protein
LLKRRASFAKALRKAHAALLKDLRTLEECACSRSSERLANLRVRLGATRAHLGEHFRLEEQDGYMDIVRKREPRLERAVQQLADEHQLLMQSLDALITEIWAATSLDDTFPVKVQAWVERIRDHETRETRLVQDAFDLDIGAED